MKSSVVRWRCYRYKDFYTVVGWVYSPVLDEWVKAEFILDTGFRGDIFLEKKLYDSLKLYLVELPVRTAPIARTMAGSIPLRASITKLKIAGFNFLVKAYTPLYGYGKNLMGRGVINRLTVLLKENVKTCIKMS